MIAATGAKNGALWPHTPFAIAQARATATAAWNMTRQATRTRCQRVRMDTRERSVASSRTAGMRSVERAAVLQEVEAEERLGERAARGHPALARIEAARAGLALGRVEADGVIAAARRLLQRQPMQLRRQAGAPPRRAQEQHPQVRAAGDAHVRAVALGRVVDADVARGLAAGLDRHRAPGRVLLEPLADRPQLEAARRRPPAVGRPLEVGLEAEPRGTRERAGVLRAGEADVERGDVRHAASVAGTPNPSDGRVAMARRGQ